MNNQFTPRVSDIITYSKEEANRLNNSYIGPEHLLLGILREGEGKAIEVLFNLQIDLKKLKTEMENRLLNVQNSTPLHIDDINFNNVASRILKLCILEARQMKCEAVDSEHILLAIMRQKENIASQLLEKHEVTYDKIMEMLSLQPDTTTPHSGLGFDE
jgi:ATP-dependent Clp protease ATP-binding subunit ClpC